MSARTRTQAVSTGPAEPGRCSMRRKGCEAVAKGIVTPFLLADGSVQVRACAKCVRHLVEEGHWSEPARRDGRHEPETYDGKPRARPRRPSPSSER